MADETASNLTGPPLERCLRHGEARKSSPTRLLCDSDTERMPAASFYKSMSLDIIEGHQIGLYCADGTLRYPFHHTQVGGSYAASLEFGGGSREPPIVGIVRRRPASANPGGRLLKPEAVHDIMRTEDIEGAKPSSFSRARQENNILNAADLNQRKSSPLVRCRSPQNKDTNATSSPADDEAVPESQREYDALHKHTTMHRPKDQGKPRPHSARVAGRAPGSDPLCPVYYLSTPGVVAAAAAAPSQAVLAASAGRHTSPTQQRQQQVRQLIEHNEQPAPGQCVKVLSDRIVISMPLQCKAKSASRKSHGVYGTKETLLRPSNPLAGSMSEDGARTLMPAWDRLDVSEVNHRPNLTEEKRQHLLQSRAEVRFADPSVLATAEDLEAGGPSVMLPLNAYMNYRDVPYATSAWKLRLLELRAERKASERAAEQHAVEQEEELLLRSKRYTNPLVPEYPSLGASQCTTTTAQFSEHGPKHNAAVDAAQRLGASPKKRIPTEDRRLRDGEHCGTAECRDIAGTSARDGPVIRPKSASSLQLRIARDLEASARLAKCETSFSRLAHGDPTSTAAVVAAPSPHLPRRPSSATVRSAATGAVAQDQKSAAASRRHEVQLYGGALERFEPTKVSSTIVKMQSLPNTASSQVRGRSAARPPPHAANRKDLLYQQDIESVRCLPNFV